MNITDIKDLYRATPFEPFELFLTNETTVKILHPEFISFSPDSRTVHVWEPTGGGKRVDVKLIIALNEFPSAPGKRKNRKK